MRFSKALNSMHNVLISEKEIKEFNTLILDICYFVFLFKFHFIILISQNSHNVKIIIFIL